METKTIATITNAISGSLEVIGTIGMNIVAVCLLA